MKKSLFLLVGLLVSLCIHADMSFDSNKKYRIICDQWWGAGTLALGANHGSTAYVYYVNVSAEQTPADGWWYIRKDGRGYTISNAQSGEYLTYRDERIDGVVKGLVLTTDVAGDESRWTFGEDQGSYYIANVMETEQWINVRMDGTQLVGTYDSHGGKALNEHFTFCDEDGNIIGETEGGGNGGGEGGGEVTPPSTGTFGTTPDGMYWENTGLSDPIVYTTDSNNPVLYAIKNISSDQWVSVQNGSLYQDATTASKFYFMRTGNGTAIYAENKQFVSTYFSSYMQQPLYLTTTSLYNNVWNIGHEETELPGYVIYKNSTNNNQWGSKEYTYWNNYHASEPYFIGLWTLDSGCTFIFASDDERHLQHLQDKGFEFAPVVSTNFPSYVDTLRLSNKDLIFDNHEEVYYFPLPEYLRGGKDFTTTLTWTAKTENPDYHLTINGIRPDETTGEITLPAVTCAEDYTLAVVKDEEGDVATVPLRFTFLPIVEVNVPTCNGSYYTEGTFRVTDCNPSLAYDSLVIAAFKYRGATAQNYPKKSYAIKLRDADGNSVDREYLGFRNDNNWILDAMAVDKACMRNRVSTDLWNDFSANPYHKKDEPKARVGTRGKFVEVFLNGAYHGLYCMTEKMDRKQLKLKKFDEATGTAPAAVRGSLYKSSDWTYETFMGHEDNMKYFPKEAPKAYDNHNFQETWAGYEIKYPDYESEPIDWGPLWNAINLVATSSDTDFDNKFGKYFDRPVVDDYYLLIELSLATDNHGKNMFFFNYDQQAATNKDKIGVTLWDMDGTWGRRWDGSRNVTDADQDYDTFLWQNEHGAGTMFHRLAQSGYLNWKIILSQRYAKLRTTFFDANNLKKRFTDYAELFAESRADQREETKWRNYHSDIQGDVEYICEWIDTRLATLDQQYNYVEPEGIDNITDQADYVGVRGSKGAILLNVMEPMTIRVFDMSGKLVRTADVQRGMTRLDGIVAGVYVVAGKKVVVE